MINNLKMSAASLVDGGWTSSERDELISEFELTVEEADDLCAAMYEIEHDI